MPLTAAPAANPQTAAGTEAASTAEQFQRQYRPDIDGLRAIAILSVVLYHAAIPRLIGGFTGVDIFFVISGYLIGGHIFAEARAGDFSFLRFYQRRARRILPAFFAVTALTLAAGLLLLSPAEMEKLGREAFAATLSASNLLFWHGANYFDMRSELHPLLMTWSLGVEEQFYAVIPWLMVLLARWRRGAALPAILLVCGLSFAFSWAMVGSHPAFGFYMLPSRAWELGVGVALAVAQLEPPRARKGSAPGWQVEAAALAGLALMLAPVVFLSRQAAFPGPAALPTVLGAALAIAFPGTWINRRLLSFPLLALVGKISYSWYLWHWPLLALAYILYGGDPPRTVTWLAIAASLALAVLSWRFIEQPFRRSRRPPVPLLWRYGLASAALLAASAAVWVTHGASQRFPDLARVEYADPPPTADPCLAEDTDQLNRSAFCFDTADSRPAVALWGDSHAAALAPGLRSLAHDRGYSFIEVAKAACAPLEGASHFVPREPALARQCFRFNSSVLDLLNSDRRVRVVVLSAAWAGYLYHDWQGGWLVSDPAHQRDALSEDETRKVFTQSLAGSVRSLQAADRLVLVADDNPAFDFEPLWKIRTNSIPLRRILARWFQVPDSGDPGFGPAGNPSGAAVATSLVAEALATAPGGALIDLKAPFHTATGEYIYRDGNRLLFGDNNHLSSDGARYAVQAIHLPVPTGPAESSLQESPR